MISRYLLTGLLTLTKALFLMLKRQIPVSPLFTSRSPQYWKTQGGCIEVNGRHGIVPQESLDPPIKGFHVGLR